jgi:hypothetical protein
VFGAHNHAFLFLALFALATVDLLAAAVFLR